tara:strand:- start:611 stop:1054 length:444 start_codon:yes stop_codon:yes gene_type:complete
MLAQACAAARRLQVLSGASPRLALGTPAWGVRHLAPRPFQLPVWEPPANPEKALEIKRYSPVLFEHVGYAFLVHTGKAFRRVKVSSTTLSSPPPLIDTPRTTLPGREIFRPLRRHTHLHAFGRTHARTHARRCPPILSPLRSVDDRR